MVQESSRANIRFTVEESIDERRNRKEVNFKRESYLWGDKRQNIIRLNKNILEKGRRNGANKNMMKNLMSEFRGFRREIQLEVRLLRKQNYILIEKNESGND